jgi:hypothetical protein
VARTFTPVAGETHHIVLSDGATTMGFMSNDMMRSFRRIPVARTSLKTSSGSTLYSDMEEPYHTIMQDDFSGGRALKHFRDDPTRFYDSNGCDTRFKGKVFLGPKVHRTTAQVGIPYYEPGNVSDVSVPYLKVSQELVPNAVTITKGEVCQSFTALERSILSVGFYVTDVAGTGTINVLIREDSSGQPNFSASLGTKSVSVTVATTGWQTATFSSPITVTAGTTYWVCIGYQDVSFKLYYQETTNPYADGIMGAYALGSWGAQPTNDLGFRVHFAQIKRAMSFNYAGSGTYSLTHVQLMMRKSGTVTPTVAVYADSGGPTGSALATVTLQDADIGTSYGWIYCDTTNVTLNKGSTYWIVVYDATQRTAPDNMLYIGADAAAGYSGGSAMSKIGSAAWAADSTNDFYFRINGGEGFTNDVFKIFEYRQQLYAVDKPQEGAAASALWMNGDRGVCDSNSADKTKLNDATKDWTPNEWAGCIVKIIGGPGYGEYRTIASNTATVLTVTDTWTTTHTTASEYVILASSKWTNITAQTAITKPVTDIVEFYSFLFIAQGDAAKTNIYQAYNNSGTYATRNASDIGGYNEYFYQLHRYTDRLYGSAVKGVYPDDGCWIYYASHKDWGTDLDIDVDKRVEIGVPASNVTGLCMYEGDLYVAKADGLWAIKGSVASLVLDYRAFNDDHNGRNICKHNVYLLFPVGYGLQRMYNLQIDNIGPDRDEGLPEGRQGYVDDMLPVPGELYAALNAGATGTSSILCYNELGWHEIVRGDSLAPIQCMYLQVIPGGPNRLWFGMDNNACWVNVPSKGLDPTKETACDYAGSGEVVTAWIDMSLAEVEKYFKELKVVSEGLSVGAQTITAYYQVDDANDSSTWTLIGTFSTSPSQELSIGNAITGRRIRFKFVLATTSSTLTPKMLAWTMDALARVEPKSRWEPDIKLEDGANMLNGEPDPITRAEKIVQLDTWAGSATPLTITTCDPAYTDVTVVLEPFVETVKDFRSNPDHIVSVGRLILLEA